MTFDDYGPYRGAPGDPRTPDDDRSIDEMTPEEQRRELAQLSHGDLVQQCLDALADAALWQQTAAANEAKAMRYLTQLGTAEGRLRDVQEQLVNLRRRLAVAEEHVESLTAYVYPNGVAA